MRRALRNNGLALAFLLFFLLALGGQSYAGWKDYNEEQTAHHESTISYGRYVVSSNYGQAVLENWQSEYLQFALYIFLTIYLVQRGSTESKEPGKEGRESDEEQQVGDHARPDSPAWARARGLRLWLFSNSLLLLMAAIWIASWFGQSVTGWSDYNSDQITHHEATVDWLGYLGTPHFWESTLQNWQSEFLAVGSMVVFSIYLRQRGSPESKPVGAPHDATGVEG
jgi:hypothetical protein